MQRESFQSEHVATSIFGKIYESKKQPFGVYFLAIASFFAHVQLHASENWNGLLRAMEYERTSAVSGRVEAIGTETFDDVTSEIRMRSFFDDLNRRFVFLHTSNNPDAQDQVEKTFGVWDLQDRRVFFSDYNASDPRLFIQASDVERTRGLFGSKGFLDFRTLGLVNYYELYSSISLKTALNRWKPEKAVARLADGRLVASYTMAGGRMRVSTTLNPEKGFAIEKLTVENGKLVDGEFVLASQAVEGEELANLNARGIDAAKLLPDVATRYDIEWTKFNNVWLPVDVKISVITPATRSAEGGLKNGKYSLEIKLAWQDVNEVIPESSFAFTELGLPPNTKLYDRRSEPIKFLGEIGIAKSTTILGMPLSKRTVPWWVKVTAVLLSLGLIAYFGLRKVTVGAGK